MPWVVAPPATKRSRLRRAWRRWMFDNRERLFGMTVGAVMLALLLVVLFVIARAIP